MCARTGRICPSCETGRGRNRGVGVTGVVVTGVVVTGVVVTGVVVTGAITGATERQTQP